MSKINLTINADSSKELNEILADLAGSGVEKVIEENTEAVTKGAKSKTKPKAQPDPKKEVASTVSTSKVAASETGAVVEPIKEPEAETSLTAGQYPNATLEDVTKAMQEAQKAGKLSVVKAAMGRLGVNKISELKTLQETKMDAYSVFLTDLEELMKG